MEKFSYLKSHNAPYLDEQLERYLQNPFSVEESWRYFFEGLELGSLEGRGVSRVEGKTVTPEVASEAKVVDLIYGYREFGILLSDINPLNPPLKEHPGLSLAHFGLNESDLSRSFTAGQLIGLKNATLQEILAHLKETYCRTIGVEFMHIQHPETQNWLQKKMESTRNRPQLNAETKKFIYKRLVESESFERFLHTRYVAQKRFSLEGGESFIVALDCMIETGTELGVKEFVLGMAHRGRLNVLTHILGKKPETIFTEFEAKYHADSSQGEGDVKYHKGYSSDFVTRMGKKVHLSMASNPSHLEAINPVIEGIARARQEMMGDLERSQVVPFLAHGDAAFAGQGICYETLNLSQLMGYRTGGTVHVVTNNQIGFTTNPEDSRSTPYATDLAKMLNAPIFHVNGDDPEAVWTVSNLAMEYRQRFKSDVFIDLICYRKYGHNEGDEPSFTQPKLYQNIKSHTSTRELYGQKLQQENILSEAEVKTVGETTLHHFEEAQKIAKTSAPHPGPSVFEGAWQGLRQANGNDVFTVFDTRVKETQLLEISKSINQMPEGFHLHPKLGRFFDSRLKSVESGVGIDWGNGETLAFATLIKEGFPVRLSGQDVGRGTFTHRHSVLHDYETGEIYVPLNHLSSNRSHSKQAFYGVYNSSLSEAAVLGFEHGYSLAAPKTLVIWEAQFGDFANGAQVIIDQFLASSESKWQRMSGLVLLLPHGYEGQGPEHSSARLERFLSLSGKNNWSVCNLTTPAQLFHALRRQMKRDFRKPLIIMSPKSLLRHPLAVSALSDFSQNNFEEVLEDPLFEKSAVSPKPQVRRVILCSGKIYYDLVSEREQRKIKEIAIIRVEQLYPWAGEKIKRILGLFSKAKEIVWVQEEPRNMGAWSYIFGLWNGGSGEFQKEAGGRPIQYIGRDEGAAPAVGYARLHEAEQKNIIEKALS